MARRQFSAFYKEKFEKTQLLIKALKALLLNRKVSSDAAKVKTVEETIDSLRRKSRSIKSNVVEKHRNMLWNEVKDFSTELDTILKSTEVEKNQISVTNVNNPPSRSPYN